MRFSGQTLKLGDCQDSSRKTNKLAALMAISQTLPVSEKVAKKPGIGPDTEEHPGHCLPYHIFGSTVLCEPYCNAATVIQMFCSAL